MPTPSSLSLVGACLLLFPAMATAQDVIESDTHTLEQVADGVYFAVGNGTLFTMSNALIIERDEDLVVVDSHITPAASRALIDSIRLVSNKPITTIINSHFHYDHANGVSTFGPNVQIIGHEVTRERLSGDPMNEQTFLSSLARFDRTIANLETSLEDASGDERVELQRQLGFWRAHVRAQEEIDPVPPTVSINDRMTLYRGGREIQIHFFGRAHTGGDLVIYLPEEKIAFTGDMMLGGISYMGDGYVSEWGKTLQRLKQLDIEMLLPGHGTYFYDLERIDNVQAYYDDLTAEVTRLKDSGYSAEEAAARADLRQHGDTLNVRQLGANLQAVQRMYDLIDGKVE